MADHPTARQQAWPRIETDAVETGTESTHILTFAISGAVQDLLPRHVLAPEALVRQGSMDTFRPADLVGPNAPDLILSPLVARGFDAMDLLTRLREADYRGRYLVLSPDAPHVALIRSDMQAAAPNVNVDVIVLDGTSVLHEIL